MTKSLLAVKDVYISYLNNLDNNHPLKKKLCLLWDPDPWSILTFQDLRFTSVTTGKLPKRLGPQAEVNQRG